MKNNINIMRTTITALAIALMPLSMAAQKVKQLTILHTNDTHSCILPVSKNLADTTLAGRGGFARRVAVLNEERKKDPDLLYFDSGDFSQGSAYYTMFKGDVEVGLMNKMGIAASTIGNHEFDFGVENLARLADNANFPILCSNYDFTGTALEGKIKPYIIIKRKGLKIGVFALDPELEGLVSAKTCKGVKFLDPRVKAKEMSEFLKKKKKCDLVILISHLGWGDTKYEDPNIIANSRYIDLVLGGHSHSYFQTLKYAKNLDGKDIPVDQNGKNAAFIGKMTLTVEK